MNLNHGDAKTSSLLLMSAEKGGNQQPNVNNGDLVTVATASEHQFSTQLQSVEIGGRSEGGGDHNMQQYQNLTGEDRQAVEALQKKSENRVAAIGALKKNATSQETLVETKRRYDIVVPGG